MESKTHLEINPRLCGTPVALAVGSAVVTMTTTDDMKADGNGLVHGGFIFGLADYAAMLAVNDPYVVLGASESRFLKPVAVGEEVEATARVTETKGRKRVVEVRVVRGNNEVFAGTFTTFVLENHVLEPHHR